MAFSLLVVGDSIAAEPNTGFVPMLAARLAEAGQDWDITNSSVPSSNIFDALDRVQELGQEPHFDAAVVFIGINDSKVFIGLDEPLVPREWFALKFEDFCRRLQGFGAQVLLCGLPRLDFERVSETGILDQYWYWIPEDYESYSDTIRIVADRDHERHFVDLAFAFNASQDEDLFGPDGVHPSTRGHMAIAKAISEVLLGVAFSTS